MTAKINYLIGKAGFEVVRDKLFTIISEEIPQQATLETDPDLKTFLQSVQVFQERFVPYSPGETPNINIVFSGGMLQPASRGNQTHEPKFFIDITVQEPTVYDDTNSVVEYGDTKASIRMQRLIQIVRNILTFPDYSSIDLKPVVGRVNIANIEVFQPQRNSDEAGNIICGRLNMDIQNNEITLPNTTTDVIEGNDSQIYPSETDDYGIKKEETF